SSEDLSELYTRADLFVMASRFEGYGMAFSEAIAHGLPVVGTDIGALRDTVPAGAGVLVAPDDAAALATALRRLIDNAAERRRMADNARAAAQTLPRGQDSANLFAAAIEAALGAAAGRAGSRCASRTTCAHAMRRSSMRLSIQSPAGVPLISSI